jgi:hypothetical protein
MSSSSPSAPDIPPIKEFKSAQYEFNDEQNKQIAGLADAMRVTAGLMQLLGLAFVVFFALALIQSLQASTGYGPPIGLGAAALVCLCIGFWTGNAVGSFRKIVETKNEDIWHLMNALGSLHNMYAFLRLIILGSLVLAVIGLALVVSAFLISKEAT